MLLRLKQLSISMIVLSLLLLSGCGQVDSTSFEDKELLQVHFLDVGQADSTLVVSPSGQAILIDGGNRGDGSEVLSYLKSQGIKELSAIVATHPHEDHIGGLDRVIQSIPTKTIYIPSATSNTKTFEDFMTAVNTSGAKKIQAKAGLTLDIPGITGLVLAPSSSSYEDLNNYSIVLKISYGKLSFLFQGDAEDISELEMINSGEDLKVNVLKVGHHGSNSSTTSDFLKAVSPQHAIISVGSDNDYDHPNQTVLEKLANAGVKIYRTDQLGTIVSTTDGKTIKFEPEAPEPEFIPSPTTSDATTNGSVELSSIDLHEEVVSIINNSDKMVNLTGWKLVSEEGSQTYDFPSGTILNASGSLKVLSGENARAGTDSLVWTQSNIWNNDGDPGMLYNAQGQLVSKL